MIDEMADGKAIDYDYISKRFDTDEYWLWRSFRSRSNKITSYSINKNTNNTNKNSNNTISSEEFFQRDLERKRIRKEQYA